jgi:thiol-disulfide isomerase/thioredoxin
LQRLLHRLAIRIRRASPIADSTSAQASPTSASTDLTTRRRVARWNRRVTVAVAAAGLACLPFVETGIAATPDGSSLEAAAPPSLQRWTEGHKPAWQLDKLHGGQLALQSLQGNVVLVHFFATWCEPCVREITSLQKLATATRGKPVTIVAIDVAEVDLRVRAFFDKVPADFAVLFDRDRAVTRAWQVSALPTTFVLDASLAPRLFVEGDLDWSHAEILTTLESLYPAAGQEKSPREQAGAQ